jgi:mono/diheme cytochrome c family protein
MRERGRKSGLIGWFAALAVLVILTAMAVMLRRESAPEPFFSEDPAVISQGARIYAERCALCHGGRLQGQPNWQSPAPDGLMPAPPHNSDGHTWHHDSATLVGITKYGLIPPWAPKGYRSGMPGFAGRLSDEEVRTVLSFIASTWNEEAKNWQQQIEMQTR